MKEIGVLELSGIKGGSISITAVGMIVFAVFSAIVFIAGIIDGYTNPGGCRWSVLVLIV